MARVPFRSEEQAAIATSDAASRVMAEGAAAAGLAWPVEAFAGAGVAGECGASGEGCLLGAAGSDCGAGALAEAGAPSEHGSLAEAGVPAEHGFLAETGHDSATGTLAKNGSLAGTSSLAERLGANPFLMAPMAGVTDAAYRMMMRAGGAALAYTEMVSVTGIHYKSEKTWQLVEPNLGEPDIAVQLFGSDPDHFREAAVQVAERVGEKLALVDVNMACPVPKVTKGGAGSALLSEPERAAQIVRALREELSVPVTVKIRAGRTPDALVGPDFARAMEAAGAQAVAVHGRVASQMYRGESDAGLIAEVVRAVSVPVIASGDALTAARSADLLEKTGAAACFVARGSYGDPWIFENARRVAAGECEELITVQMRLAAFRLHVRLLEATGAHMARARSLAGWYLRGVPEAAAWRERAMHCKGTADYLALADELEASL